MSARRSFLDASTWALMVLLPTLAGCGSLNSDNSVSNDADLFGSTTGGSAEFTAAREVIARNCVSCHVSFGRYTEEQWKSSGYVKAASPSTSSLFTKLRSAGFNGNMPPSGTLSTDEINKIKAWIEKL